MICIPCIAVELMFPPQLYDFSLLMLFVSLQCKEGMKRYQGTEHESNENLCSLCENEQINFTPPPNIRFCVACLNIISPLAVYYSMGSPVASKDDLTEDKFICRKCFSVQNKNITINGQDIPKSSLRKKQAYGGECDTFEPVRIAPCHAYDLCTMLY